jgi:hypothetical protein
MNRTGIFAMALAMLSIVGAATDALAQGACVSRGDARRLLEQREVAPFPEALNRAGVRRRDVLPDGVELCGRPGNFYYRFRTLRDGRIGHREIPAR